MTCKFGFCHVVSKFKGYLPFEIFLLFWVDVEIGLYVKASFSANKPD